MRPREFDHDDVLRIAFEQFWRKGVRGTSLSDIARDAGVKRGSLYTYVKNEQIFVCPTDDIGQVTGLTYAMNSCVGTDRGNNYYLGKKMSAFQDTAKWMLVGEETMNVNDWFNSTDDGFLS